MTIDGSDYKLAFSFLTLTHDYEYNFSERDTL